MEKRRTKRKERGWTLRTKKEASLSLVPLFNPSLSLLKIQNLLIMIKPGYRLRCCPSFSFLKFHNLGVRGWLGLLMLDLLFVGFNCRGKSVDGDELLLICFMDEEVLKEEDDGFRGSSYQSQVFVVMLLRVCGSFFWVARLSLVAFLDVELYSFCLLLLVHGVVGFDPEGKVFEVVVSLFMIVLWLGLGVELCCWFPPFFIVMT